MISDIFHFVEVESCSFPINSIKLYTNTINTVCTTNLIKHDYFTWYDRHVNCSYQWIVESLVKQSLEITKPLSY